MERFQVKIERISEPRNASEANAQVMSSVTATRRPRIGARVMPRVHSLKTSIGPSRTVWLVKGLTDGAGKVP